MIKRVGGFIRFVVFLAAVCLVGYNTWELSRLRAEVATLRRLAATTQKKRIADAPPAPVEPSGLGFAPQWMTDAQKHAERAQAFLRNKRYADAKTEMDQAIALVQKNGQTAQKESRDALQKLQKAADTVSVQAAALWEKGGSEAGKSTKQP